MRISYEYNKNLKERARELRKAGNVAEIILWKQIKNKKFLGLDFTRQTTIGNFIADFCCESKKLIIEVDGGYHINRKTEDKMRDEFLLAAGFKIIRISSDDVIYNLDYTLNYLADKIKKF